ncbi:MAG: hypothetical protein BGN97_16875 [Microbacterium sp. 69-10]|uniref:DUF2442 domain-containing protein n=1 Tax=Microbacterium sp. 69-10 TaxID=1895783 RepID=UPI00095CEA54|nr:DUF2442 domain-containing protein [Microbacterium sp. 69-10]OJU40858.1 MAG: hypothetical protein BGN97_16875 [Microbacterium sp. 69-10]
MNISTHEAIAVDVHVDQDQLHVRLQDGRTISTPLDWFPLLAAASAEQRAAWRIIGAGEGIHWPMIDEDISVEGLLAGR